MEGNNGSPAVFFDRDGTLMEEVDYCGRAEDVRVFPGAAEALQRLKDAGFKLIVITNQSGIGRGYFTESDYLAVQREVERQLGRTLIDATYYCPHRPDENCTCRKPSPEMLRRAAQDHGLDRTRSYFVGDKESDLACGRNAGVPTVLVETGYGASVDRSGADFVAPNLAEAADLILRRASAARA